MKGFLAVALLAVSPVAMAALTADQQGALDAHNAARKTKNLPALTWDNSLVVTAQKCADKIAASGKFDHCESAENLYWETLPATSPMTDATKVWVNEKSNYHGEKIPDGNFQSYGHYST
jgi:pathogenesis-related protein 1